MTARTKTLIRLSLTPLLGAAAAVVLAAVAAVVIGGPVGLLFWLVGETVVRWMAVTCAVVLAASYIMLLGWELSGRALAWLARMRRERRVRPS